MWITCWLVVVFVMGAGPAAAQSAPPLTRIAFGSCAHHERPQPIWEAVLQYRPELFLFLGDNVYGDVRVAYPMPADNVSRLPPSRLSRVNQPVISTRNRFLSPPSHPLACF